MPPPEHDAPPSTWSASPGRATTRSGPGATSRAAGCRPPWATMPAPPPTTAELLVWLCILSARGESAETIGSGPLAGLPGLGALVKDKQDLEVLG